MISSSYVIMIGMVMMLVVVATVLDNQVGHKGRPAGTGGVGVSATSGHRRPAVGRSIVLADAHGRRLSVEQIPVRIVRHPRHVRSVRRLSGTWNEFHHTRIS